MKGTVLERFLAKVAQQPHGCWEWLGARSDKHQHGKLSVGGKGVYTHRVAYELFIGHIPDGLKICHTCDNPGCVNPAHLFVGTNKDNTQDALMKGRLVNTAFTKGATHYKAKLDDEQVKEIRRLCAAGASRSIVAEQYGVAYQTVGDIVTRRHWKHIPPEDMNPIQENILHKVRNMLKPQKTSQYVGVSWHKQGKKWQAQIKINGRRHYLGLFDNEENAHEAYLKAMVA